MIQILEKPRHERSQDDNKTVIATLTSVEFFRQRGAHDINLLKRICWALRLERLGARRVLFKQGDKGDRLYLLLDGRVSVHTNVYEPESPVEREDGSPSRPDSVSVGGGISEQDEEENEASSPGLRGLSTRHLSERATKLLGLFPDQAGIDNGRFACLLAESLERATGETALERETAMASSTGKRGWKALRGVGAGRAALVLRALAPRESKKHASIKDSVPALPPHNLSALIRPGSQSGKLGGFQALSRTSLHLADVTDHAALNSVPRPKGKQETRRRTTTGRRTSKKRFGKNHGDRSKSVVMFQSNHGSPSSSSEEGDIAETDPFHLRVTASELVANMNEKQGHPEKPTLDLALVRQEAASPHLSSTSHRTSPTPLSPTSPTSPFSNLSLSLVSSPHGRGSRKVSTGSGYSRRNSGTMMRVADLKAGDVFGEMALQSDIPRTATILTETDVCVATLSRKDYQDILSDFVRTQTEEHIRFLATVPVLEGLPRETYAKIVAHLQRHDTVKNEVVYSTSTHAVQAYIVRDGEFAVYRKGASGSDEGSGQDVGKSETILTSVIPRLQVFGLMGYLRGEKRYTEKVVCKSVTGSVYRIVAKDLMKILSLDLRQRLLKAAHLQKRFYENRIRVLGELMPQHTSNADRRPSDGAGSKGHLGRSVLVDQGRRRWPQKESLGERVRRTSNKSGRARNVYHPEDRLRIICGAFQQSVAELQPKVPVSPPVSPGLAVRGAPSPSDADALTLRSCWFMEDVASQRLPRHKLARLFSWQPASDSADSGAASDVAAVALLPQQQLASISPEVSAQQAMLNRVYNWGILHTKGPGTPLDSFGVGSKMTQLSTSASAPQLLHSVASAATSIAAGGSHALLPSASRSLVRSDSEPALHGNAADRRKREPKPSAVDEPAKAVCLIDRILEGSGHDSIQHESSAHNPQLGDEGGCALDAASEKLLLAESPSRARPVHEADLGSLEAIRELIGTFRKQENSSRWDTVFAAPAVPVAPRPTRKLETGAIPVAVWPGPDGAVAQPSPSPCLLPHLPPGPQPSGRGRPAVRGRGSQRRKNGHGGPPPGHAAGGAAEQMLPQLPKASLSEESAEYDGLFAAHLAAALCASTPRRRPADCGVGSTMVEAATVDLRQLYVRT